MYYQWRKNGHVTTPRTQKRQTRDDKIKDIFEQSKERYGVTRIQVELAEVGTPAVTKTIADSMRRQRLVPKAARKFKITTDSDHQLPVAPNLLERDFTATAPNPKFLGVSKTD